MKTLFAVASILTLVGCTETVTGGSGGGTGGTGGSSESTTSETTTSSTTVDIGPTTGGSCDDCLSQPVSWAFIGLTQFTDKQTISGCRDYSMGRYQGSSQTPEVTCGGPLACDASSVNIAAINNALASQDVIDALANPGQVWGYDDNCSEGGTWITVGDQSVRVGPDCDGPFADICGGGAGCVPPPPGLDALKKLLDAVESQGKGAEDCVVKLLPDVPCTDCLGTTVSWGASGGLSSWFDSFSVADCRVFNGLRTPGYGQDPDQPDITCTGEIGGCDAAAPAVHDLEIALTHPDVVAALAEPTTPLFGWDATCTDGNLFIIGVGDKSIQLGEDCETGFGCKPSAGQCRKTPPGVQHLAKVLGDIEAQQLQTPDCAGKFN